MNILPINRYNLLQDFHLKSANPAFLAKRDEVSFSYIEKVEQDKSGKLQCIRYKYPISVANVFKKMTCEQDPFRQARFIDHMHSSEEIKEISSLLMENHDIGSIKVKSLIGFGAFAYVFETENGLALKITYGSHFPNERKPADFDFPIIKSGKITPNNIYYYFLEEIANQDNLNDSEIKDLIKNIQSQGYVIRDYYKWNSKILNHKQFGRASDGKVYLLDPGCVVATNIHKEKISIIKKFLNLLKKGTR